MYRLQYRLPRRSHGSCLYSPRYIALEHGSADGSRRQGGEGGGQGGQAKQHRLEQRGRRHCAQKYHQLVGHWQRRRGGGAPE